MFWLSEKIAGVFHFFFGKSPAQKVSADFIDRLKSFDFVEGVSKLGKTYSILTNQVSKNGNLIHLYLSDDCQTLHDGGQVLANTSELVMETQVVPNLPSDVKLIDGYLVNESFMAQGDLLMMMNLIKAY